MSEEIDDLLDDFYNGAYHGSLLQGQTPTNGCCHWRAEAPTAAASPRRGPSEWLIPPASIRRRAPGRVRLSRLDTQRPLEAGWTPVGRLKSRRPQVSPIQRRRFFGDPDSLLDYSRQETNFPPFYEVQPSNLPTRWRTGGGGGRVVKSENAVSHGRRSRASDMLLRKSKSWSPAFDSPVEISSVADNLVLPRGPDDPVRVKLILALGSVARRFSNTDSLTPIVDSNVRDSLAGWREVIKDAVLEPESHQGRWIDILGSSTTIVLLSCTAYMLFCDASGSVGSSFFQL